MTKKKSQKGLLTDSDLRLVQADFDGEPYPYTAIMRKQVRPCPGAVGEYIDFEVDVVLRDTGYNEEFGVIESEVLNINLNFK